MKMTNLIQEGSFTYHQSEFGVDVLTGLSSQPKRISSIHFYDDIGSELFQKISKEQDYYLTTKEFWILKNLSDELPGLMEVESDIDIIELGAGDGHKSKLLIDGFTNSGVRVHYYPIDISEKAMLLLQQNIQDTSKLVTNGIVADYFTGLHHVHSISSHRKIILFLGSTIGNFEQRESLKFLRKLWNSLSAGDFVLIGFDQKKDTQILNRAYNDSKGYTQRFNLNLLTRINRELEADFVIENFRHYGFYNPHRGAMESYLISLKEQTVQIKNLKKNFSFSRFEPIHLEFSFKFLPSDIDYLSHQTGFQTVKNFPDEEHYFIDSLWRVQKDE